MIASLFALPAALAASQMAVCAYDPARRLIANAGWPTPQFEATPRPWFKAREVLVVNGVSYRPEGAPEKLFNTAFTTVMLKDGIPVLAREPLFFQPRRLYLMINSKRCGFQPYVSTQR